MAFCAMRFAMLFAITSSAEFLEDTDMTKEQAIQWSLHLGLVSADAQARERCSRPIQDRCRQLELEDRDFDLHRLLGTWK
jgi:hypothetical protein